MTGVDPHDARTPQDIPDLTLAEFYLARLAEIERREQGKIRYGVATGKPCPVCGREVREHGMDNMLDVVRHTLAPCGHELLDPDYAAWAGTESTADPFVLHDVAAKRRIVELHTPQAPAYDDESSVRVCGTCGTQDGFHDMPAPCPTLRLLAEVYADHPDYRSEWRL